VGDPIQDPLNIHLPEDLSNTDRVIFVAPYKMSTFRLMHDPYDTDRDRWFDQGAGMPHVTDGNEVMLLVRGQETYADMVVNMKEAARNDPSRPHEKPPFIYVGAWDFEDSAYRSMELVPGDASSTPKAIFEAAASAGTDVRVLAWANNAQTPWDTPATASTVDQVNALATGRGIVDWKTGVWFDVPATQYRFHRGAHHQKIQIVHGSYPLVSYLGGIDLDPGRLDGASAGWHDVHCRLRGPAADSVLLCFRQRWIDYLNTPDPDSNHDTHKPTGLSPFDLGLRNQLVANRLPPSGPVDSEPYRQSVQVCRTFHSQLYNIPPGGMAGEKSIRSMVVHAINQANYFIYIEDQYLFSMEISDELKKAIAKPTFRWLIILISDDNHYNSEVADQKPYRRALFLNNLLNAPGGEKVRAFIRRDRYVHSKIYIVDDKLAVIGSANCNRRGMQHDSEISAAIFDRSSNAEPAVHFARRMRMRLWATHLNLAAQSSDPNIPSNSQAEFAELADGVASAVHWIKRAASVRMVEYVVNQDLNLAINGLKAKKAELEDKVKKSVPKLLQPQALAALDFALIQFTPDQHGVDNAWNTLIDPGDP
jgi:phosphatidylserine/phosphatidylglycerophosphate/cardiolipin synthase-like enzyme